jgi:hypothetical protein
MKKILLIVLMNVLILAAGAQSIKNNGHHAGGGNSGNGKGNQPDIEDEPAEVPGDPDEPTKVPLDNTPVLILLCGGVVVYGLIKNRKGSTVC